MLTALDLPTTLRTADAELVLRRAVPADLDALVALLSDDPVSTSRGDGAAAGTAVYRAALAEVLADASTDVVVVCGGDGAPLGTAQLTRTPGLARRGATRLTLEAVRVRGADRSRGTGTALVRWVVDVAAPALGATLVQLTSDEARTDAHRFYERLGFTGSHRGFKLVVDPGPRSRDGAVLPTSRT